MSSDWSSNQLFRNVSITSIDKGNVFKLIENSSWFQIQQAPQIIKIIQPIAVSAPQPPQIIKLVQQSAPAPAPAPVRIIKLISNNGHGHGNGNGGKFSGSSFGGFGGSSYRSFGGPSYGGPGPNFKIIKIIRAQQQPEQWNW